MFDADLRQDGPHLRIWTALLLSVGRGLMCRLPISLSRLAFPLHQGVDDKDDVIWLFHIGDAIFSSGDRKRKRGNIDDQIGYLAFCYVYPVRLFGYKILL
ncbi:MAG: hypothetical protein IT544_00105 [Rhodobacteraceae bacterium]|nr:hypothetical protein [Paracoccaceae bacterium]